MKINDGKSHLLSWFGGIGRLISHGHGSYEYLYDYGSMSTIDNGL